MRDGEVGILNVGAGDTKLSFDKNNPAERIRAARIVTDMLRRGYALMVEVKRRGKVTHERVLEFREDTCEYLIADFDPIQAAAADEQEEPSVTLDEDAPDGSQDAGAKGRKGRRALKADKSRVVAVARSAGG